jgi:acetylornithine deacetylase/succinyl-diaminopimelate desuccinylase-like protein
VTTTTPLSRNAVPAAAVLAAALLAVSAALAPPPLAAQQPAREAALERARPGLREALARPETQAATVHIDAARGAAADLLVRIGGIVSPSGDEYDRAAAVAGRMEAIGLASVRVTSDPNAIGVLPGRSGRALVFVSTLDDLATVAEHQRAATSGPRVEGSRVLGPGTNTSLTTVAMLTAAEALIAAGLQPEHDLVFAAVAQEETGLLGMKALYEQYRDRADAFVDILGDGHSIAYGALGLHWWRVEADGPPGHTLNGALPNVNQGIARAVDRILSLPWAALDDESRTRMNVSILSSGAVFNHKPERGWFSLDLRSMEAETLGEMEAAVREILESVSAETRTTLRMEPFQITSGGRIPGALESALVNTSRAVSEHLGYTAELNEAGSANLNVAIGAGTPAIGLGGSRGGDRGQPTEWADIDALVRTAHHVMLLGMVLGGG